ncbi:MAG TPA: hypothetical protein VKA64_05505, partial [Gammaproteobacteria bacterium]|nr:hypothetical protein [Gammaproteobacteria bacterium]
ANGKDGQGLPRWVFGVAPLAVIGLPLLFGASLYAVMFAIIGFTVVAYVVVAIAGMVQALRPTGRRRTRPRP